MTTKQKFLFDMHTVFMSLTSGDFELTMKMFETLMQFHGVTCKDCIEIPEEFFVMNIEDTFYSFGEVINAKKYESFVDFCHVCEGFLNMEPLTRKDNESKYGVVAFANLATDINAAIIQPVKID